MKNANETIDNTQLRPRMCRGDRPRNSTMYNRPEPIENPTQKTPSFQT